MYSLICLHDQRKKKTATSMKAKKSMLFMVQSRRFYFSLVRPQSANFLFYISAFGLHKLIKTYTAPLLNQAILRIQLPCQIMADTPIFYILSAARATSLVRLRIELLVVPGHKYHQYDSVRYHIVVFPQHSK